MCRSERQGSALLQWGIAHATAQAVANLAQRIGVGELAEQHRDQLCPAAKAFGAPFRVVFLDQRRELGPRKMLEQLIEENPSSSRAVARIRSSRVSLHIT
jgi:hypothetical protein